MSKNSPIKTIECFQQWLLSKDSPKIRKVIKSEDIKNKNYVGERK